MRRRFTLTLTMVLAVGVACGDEAGTIQIGGQGGNDHGTEEVSGETSVEFELDDLYFEPTVLRGDAQVADARDVQ